MAESLKVETKKIMAESLKVETITAGDGKV